MKTDALEILNDEIRDNIHALNGDDFLERRLKNKEFDIFNNITINRLGNDLRQVVLSVKGFASIPFKHLNRLVNIFHLIYGNDDNGLGKFNIEDINEIIKNTSWKGRIWMNPAKYKKPAVIRFTEGEGIQLLVIGV